MDKDQLAALDRAATQGEGPQLVVSAKLTCTGCSHLKTEWWKDYLDNDETDSGTSARCSALLDECGGKSITSYWSNNSPPPKWCPLADKPRTGQLVLIDDGAVEALAELQLAAFLAGRGSVVTKGDGRTVSAKPAPTVDDFRRMALSALGVK
jgi:hypothetical protein